MQGKNSSLVLLSLERYVCHKMYSTQSFILHPFLTISESIFVSIAPFEYYLGFRIFSNDIPTTMNEIIYDSLLKRILRSAIIVISPVPTSPIEPDKRLGRFAEIHNIIIILILFGGTPHIITVVPSICVQPDALVDQLEINLSSSLAHNFITMFLE